MACGPGGEAVNKQAFHILFAYGTIYLVWGSTYFFIKMSVETIPPYYLVGLRFCLGGILILAFSLLGGRLRRPPALRELASAFVLGTLLLTVSNNLLSAAEQRLDSYLVALCLSSTPLLVALYDRLLLRKHISPLRLAGILIGVGGVACLLYDGRSLSTSLKPEIFMVIASMLLWALGTSLGHRLPVHRDNLVNSGLMMLLAGMTSLALASLTGEPLVQVLGRASLRSVLGLSYLAVIGSLAFSAFTFLLSCEPAIRVVSYALVNPVIAVLLGLLAGNEQPVPLLALGLPLTLAGLVVMLYGELLWDALRRAVPCRKKD